MTVRFPWLEFLSTPSARRATDEASTMYIDDTISIHALCEEGDVVANDYVNITNDFYPRPLRGGRRIACDRQSGGQKISIHALCEEGDSR